MTARSLLTTLTIAAVAAIGLPAKAMSAEAWPAHPIRIVIPLPPGGVADYIGRVLSEPLRTALGQPVLVENRVGADGRIGMEYVSKQRPDGYTFVIIGTSSIAHTALFKNMPYDLIRDFTPVGLIVRTPFVLVVLPSLPINTAKDYLAYARANPGKITFGSSGVGSPFHLSGELLKSMAGVDMLHVPYKGSGPLSAALLGGEVNSGFVPIGPFLKNIRAGKLRPLGIVTGHRTESLPEMPTLDEAFPLPGFALDAWAGMLAPAGTPKEIVDRMSAEIARIVRDPQFSKERLQVNSYDSIGGTPDEMAEILKKGVVFYRKLVTDARIPSE